MEQAPRARQSLAAACHYLNGDDFVMIDWAHAITTAILLTGTYYILDHFGFLDGKSKLQRFFILAPVYFVLILALNLVWPYGS